MSLLNTFMILPNKTGHGQSLNKDTLKNMSKFPLIFSRGPVFVLLLFLLSILLALYFNPSYCLPTIACLSISAYPSSSLFSASPLSSMIRSNNNVLLVRECTGGYHFQIRPTFWLLARIMGLYSITDVEWRGLTPSVYPPIDHIQPRTREITLERLEHYEGNEAERK